MTKRFAIRLCLLLSLLLAGEAVFAAGMQAPMGGSDAMQFCQPSSKTHHGDSAGCCKGSGVCPLAQAQVPMTATASLLPQKMTVELAEAPAMRALVRSPNPPLRPPILRTS